MYKELTATEHDLWTEIYCNSSVEVLKAIVTANAAQPKELGKAYAYYELYNHSVGIVIRKAEKESITWESQYLSEMYIKELVCYRYLSKWTLNVPSEEQEIVETEWNEFYFRNKEEIDEYIENVHKGFLQVMKTYHDKYPGLKYCWFADKKE